MQNINLFSLPNLLFSNSSSNVTINNSTLGWNCSGLPFEKDGFNYTPWMLDVFGECIRTPSEQASFWIGLSSILFWLFANMPQIIENYRKSNADSLAPAFLFQWILGDSLNLIGSVLAGQLATQIATAVYYVIMDIILIGQFIYYKVKERMIKKRKENENAINSSEESPLVLGRGDEGTTYYSGKVMVFTALFLTVGFYWFTSMSTVPQMNNYVPSQSQSIGRKLLSIISDNLNDKKQDELEAETYWPITDAMSITGYVIGSLSTCLYLGSRIPQIIKNVSCWCDEI